VHILGDGQLGDAVAEQGQFRLDAPAAPGRISRAIWRIRWQISVQAVGGRPSWAWTSTASRLEALAVSGQNGGGLNYPLAHEPASG
jgi:hypothetical protein